MSVDRLADMLLRWEELREQGQPLAPEDLCHDCPELLPELRRRIVALEAMEPALRNKPTTADSQVGAQTMPSADPALEIAVFVPGYDIIRELGRGGMGVVYKAWQKSLNRFVALKMMLSGAHAGATQRLRFRREAEAAAHLHHPNIVQVYEVGEFQHQLFFSLEFIEGYGLNEVIRTGIPPFTWSAAIVEKLALAVDYANRRGIVHRDLKPANVLLEGSERPPTIAPGRGSREARRRSTVSTSSHESLQVVPKITDFGLAKRLDDDQGHTRTGDVVGTPSYMAPEQAAGKSQAIGPPVDIYALGAILYELLTAGPPFDGVTPWETVHKVINQEPVAPSRHNERAPRDLETICLKCLQKEPAKRYATGLALAEDLRRFLNGEPIAARPVGVVERGVKWVRRRPALASLLAFSAVLLLALLVGGWLTAIQQVQSNLALKKVNEVNHRSLIRLNVTQGLHYVEDEDLIGSLAWFARALNLEDDKSLEKTHRLRMAAVMKQCPRLDQLWFHKGAVNTISFTPDGKWLVTASDDETAEIRNAASGESRHGPLRHKQAVLCASFRSDGAWLVTGSLDKSACVWDAATGQRIAVFVGHTKGIVDAQFSRDGKRIVTASEDGTARVWDAASGKPIGSPMAHEGNVIRAEFNGTGDLILTASSDGAARVWKFADGKFTVQAMMKHDGPVTDAAFSPDGLFVASAGEDGTCRLWSPADGKPLAKPLVHHGSVLKVAFRPDGRRLATASADMTARIWDCKTGQALSPVMRHYSAVVSAAFSPDGKRLITASDDNTARVWDAENGRSVTPPLPHNGEVSVACFSPDGKSVATASEDTTARIYDLESTASLVPSLEHGKAILQASFDPEGGRILTASADGLARIWNARTAQSLVTLSGHKAAVVCASFDTDGRMVLTGSTDGTARLWDSANGHLRSELKGHTGPVRAARFSPDGRLAATASDDGTALVWDTATGKQLVCLKAADRDEGEGTVDVAFSPGARILATAGSTGVARLWDVATGKRIGEPMRHLEEISHLEFSPDGLQLATASLDRSAQLWSAATGQPLLAEPLRHAGPVRCVAFRADGKRLVTCGSDNTARVWDAASGTPVLPPLRHAGSVTAACFSGDGKRIATASQDNSARVWDAQTGEPITPPLSHRHWGRITSVAFNPAGDELLTASADGTAEVWPLAQNDQSSEELERLAQLLSGSRIGDDGATLVPLDTAALRKLWNELHTPRSKLVDARP